MLVPCLNRKGSPITPISFCFILNVTGSTNQLLLSNEKTLSLLLIVRLLAEFTVNLRAWAGRHG